MIIFAEGPDGVGKTEISKRLSKELNIPYFKVNTEKSNWKNNSFDKSLPFDILLPQFVKQTSTSFISDRGYISEWVYSSVFNRNSDGPALEKIDREWADQGAIALVLFRNSYDCVVDELVTSSENFRELHEMYHLFIERTKCHVITMHVDDYDNDIERQIPVILHSIDLISQTRFVGEARIDL